ncbi:putative DNA-directed RNA polymerase subunit beta, partial (apicoplast) [Toxoplasma gondii GAB2-2007-GAL-DOM2]
INQKTFYEQKYSIIWGNIILTNGVYSPNIFILKLFSNYLEYYSQYKAAKLAYIYTYYIIIESLIKQYHYNGILLPSLYFELLAKRMTNFVKIISSGEIMLTEENIISFNFV